MGQCFCPSRLRQQDENYKGHGRHHFRFVQRVRLAGAARRLIGIGRVPRSESPLPRASRCIRRCSTSNPWRGSFGVRRCTDAVLDGRTLKLFARAACVTRIARRWGRPVCFRIDRVLLPTYSLTETCIESMLASTRGRGTTARDMAPLRLAWWSQVHRRCPGTLYRPRASRGGLVCIAPACSAPASQELAGGALFRAKADA